jgi:hypothetical protein
VGTVIVKYDASRILMSLLIHCGTLNCPYVPKTTPAEPDDENSRFPSSDQEKMESTKYNWLNLLAFDTMSSTINLHLVKKIAVIALFVPIACRALRMTSVGDCANIFEDG